MKTMAVLMLIFAAAIGYATFIENDYGTITAKADIYNAFWFEVLMVLLAVNLAINMVRYKMFSIKKAPIFIFHLSFLIILLGAAITRFIGFEGTMHIREGETANTMLSMDTYFIVSAKVDDKMIESEKSVYLSKKSSNSLETSLNIEGKEVSVKLTEYIPDVVESYLEGEEGGFEMIDMMVTGESGSEPVKLRRGEYYENENIAIDFDSGKIFLRPTVSIYTQEGKLYMKHDFALGFMKMDGGIEGEIAPSAKSELELRTLFGAEGSNFVVRNFYKHTKTRLVSNPNASPMSPGMDALIFDINVAGVSKSVTIFGQAGRRAKESHDIINGVDVHIGYGSKTLELPFGIKLLDFQLERYPGSMSPASYARAY